MKKKIISLMLVFCMLFTMLPVTGIEGYAASFPLAKKLPAQLPAKQSEAIVAVALSQVGYQCTEKDCTVYASDIGVGNPNQWCAIFVFWCAQKAGIPSNVLPKITYVPDYKTNSVTKKCYHINDGKFRPEPGDIVVMRNGGHVGIVWKWLNSNTIQIIHGNTSDGNGPGSEDRVWYWGNKATIGIEYNDAQIDGYVRPNYEDVWRSDFKATRKPETGKPTLTWNEHPKAAKYNILRTVTGSSYDKIKTGVTNTSYTDTSALEITPYTYKVQAISSQGKVLEESETASIRCAFAQPVVDAVTTQNGHVQLSWSDVLASNLITDIEYRIYRYDYSNGTYKKIGQTYYRDNKDDDGKFYYIDKTGKPGETYSYKVKVLSGDSSIDNQVSATSDVKSGTFTLATPGELRVRQKVEYVNGQVQPIGKAKVTWDTVKSADGYTVLVENNDGTKSENWTSANNLEVNLYLEEGKTEKLRVRSEYLDDEDGNSPYTKNAVQFKTPTFTSYTGTIDLESKDTTTRLASPQVSIKSGATASSATLQWTTIAGAKSYAIYSSPKESGEYTTVASGITGGSYTDKNAMTPGTTKYYKVKAISGVSGIGNSLYSGVIERVAKLSTPQITVETRESGGMPRISWSAIEGADKYEILRKVGSGSYSKIGETTGVSYDDNSVTAGNTYSYKVRAVCDENSKANSISIEKNVTCTKVEVRVSSYNKAYDGKAHSITVTAPSGAVVKYSTKKNGPYTTTKPTVTYTGSQTVYYKVTMKNCMTATGSATITVRAQTPEDFFKDKNSHRRIYGADRYDTSIEIAKALKTCRGIEKFKNIIVASGGSFADAMSGTYLAKVTSAPILTVGTDINSENRIIKYIKDNLADGGTVYLLGGSGAKGESGVTTRFEQSLKSYKYEVKRLAGQDRYETNLAILKEADESQEEEEDTILVCSGDSFADGLSVGATGKPVLLVGNKLSDAQKSFLNEIKNEKRTYYLIGGEGAVSATVNNEIEKYGSVVNRAYGSNRYQTSCLVAKEFFPKDTENVVFAYASDFPDGLSAAPLAIELNAPLILTDRTSPSAAKAYVDYCGAKKSVTIGGKTLIPGATVDTIMS